MKPVSFPRCRYDCRSALSSLYTFCTNIDRCRLEGRKARVSFYSTSWIRFQIGSEITKEMSRQSTRQTARSPPRLTSYNRSVASWWRHNLTPYSTSITPTLSVGKSLTWEFTLWWRHIIPLNVMYIAAVSPDFPIIVILTISLTSRTTVRNLDENSLRIGVTYNADMNRCTFD